MISMKFTKRKKRVLITFGIIALLIGTLFAAYKLFLDPYRNTINTWGASSKFMFFTQTKEEAQEDLAYIIKKLEERHPACMEGLPDEVQAQYDIELSNLSDEVSVLQIWQSSARILSRMKDAHTGVVYNHGEEKVTLLQFEMIDGTLHCVSDGYDDAIVNRMNGIPVEELYQTFLKQASYELESYAAYQFSRYLRYNSYLEFIGLDTSSGVTLTFQTEEGEREEVMTFPVITPTTNMATDQDFVSYEIDTANNLGIFTLRSCNINDHYLETLNKFFMEVKMNDLENVVVDLRNNGGGNSKVINEFLRYINIDNYYISGGIDVRFGPILHTFKKQTIENKKAYDLLFDGKVYALTSTNTFSSAQMFAHTLSDNGIGQLIGEIPGNMPSSYGDILLFQTPNSKLTFTVSYKYFRRIDEAKESLPLIPDYEVKAEEAMDKLYKILTSDQ